ncbi:TetR/AcrR family transcriptional regulator [Amycolatopsis sp. NBC_00355]|uniref:TetR/AcrR family transcriptional regulator n=1 Tax=Amycolatopsis sp. NBC_00355 TaxID=2975957 RepID=UPI002E25FF5B
MTSNPAPARYDGDLRADLVRASLDLIAADGPQDFSVAKVAKVLRVSSAAPYRHFGGRAELLAAVAGEATTALRAGITLAVAEESDPVEMLVASTGAYTRFVIERRVDFHVIFSPELDVREAPALISQRRRLLTDSLARCRRVVPGKGPARSLLEQLVAQANGFASLFHGRLRLHPAGTADDVVGRSTRTARALIRSASGVKSPGCQEEP